MNRASKGRRQEYRSRRLLEASGYLVVRAAASKVEGGAFDLVGFGDGGLALVSVKSNAWPPAHEIEALRLWPAPPGTIRLVHRWVDGRREPDVRRV